jgi:hypothetical protein
MLPQRAERPRDQLMPGQSSPMPAAVSMASAMPKPGEDGGGTPASSIQATTELKVGHMGRRKDRAVEGAFGSVSNEFARQMVDLDFPSVAGMVFMVSTAPS